jgi:hypothetical protein
MLSGLPVQWGGQLLAITQHLLKRIEAVFDVHSSPFVQPGRASRTVGVHTQANRP